MNLPFGLDVHSAAIETTGMSLQQSCCAASFIACRFRNNQKKHWYLYQKQCWAFHLASAWVPGAGTTATVAHASRSFSSPYSEPSRAVERLHCFKEWWWNCFYMWTKKSFSLLFPPFTVVAVAPRSCSPLLQCLGKMGVGRPRDLQLEYL